MNIKNYLLDCYKHKLEINKNNFIKISCIKYVKNISI